jgi:hypothetical protein
MRTEGEFLIDVLHRLDQAQLDYMLTGSMASNYWGIPRTTHDLDFVIVAAFCSGLFIQEASVHSAFQPPYQFNVLDEQSALKADFWLLHDNVFEKAAFGRRIATELFGVSAWIATAEDVILHKLYWNKLTPSDRQLQDAAGIFAVQAGTLDRPYLTRWATILQVEHELNDLAAGGIRPKST